MRTGASLALPACPLLSDPGFSALRRYIIALTGLNYYEERRADLAVRIWARMRAAGTPDAAAYLERLRGDDADGKRERAQLIDDIAIGETYFFRFAEQFRALQDHVLPLLIRTEAASRSLNIWSAGCANGAEAYSLSILLKRSFGDALRNWSVSILATDLNARAIERARLAVYTPWALRTLDAPTRRDCFDPLPDGSFRLRARYREGVEFRVHNLLHADPPAPESGNEGRGFDLVFCRNVLIYFDDQSISRTLRTLTETLGPGGWLFLGHAEAAMVRGASAAALRTVAFTGTYVYQRVESNGGDVSETLPVLAAPADTFDAGSPGEAPSFVLPVLPEQTPVATPAAKPAPRSKPDADSPADARRAVRSLLDVGDTRTALDRLEPLLAGAASPGTVPRPARPPRHDPVLHYYHALALEEQERLEEAEAALRKALYLDRSFSLAHYHLALVAEARGDLALAARSLDSVLKIVEESGDALPGSQSDTLREIGDITPEELRDIARLRRSRLPKEEGRGRRA